MMHDHAVVTFLFPGHIHGREVGVSSGIARAQSPTNTGDACYASMHWTTKLCMIS